MNTQRLSIAAIATLAFFVFWGGAQLARKPSTSPLESDSFLNYVIPKLQQFIPKFSLWDRKFVDRRKLAPKMPLPKAAAGPQASASPAPSATPTATPKATAKAAATPTPTPMVNPDSALSAAKSDNDSPELSEDPALSNPYTDGGGLAGPVPTETPTVDSQVGEWKMKIYRSPFKQTMNDFIFEFQTGKVSKIVYYQVLEDLMKDSSSDIQKLAVYALAATPSLDSLTALLINKDQLSSDTQQMVGMALDGYNRPDKLKVLDMAIKSENPLVVLGSLPLIVKIGSRMTLWTADYSSEAGGRDRRGPTNRVPKGDIRGIIESLDRLENSSDRLISQAARDALNQLNYQPPVARQ